MRMVRSAALALLAVMIGGSADAQSIECHGALKPQQVAELLFGRRIGDHGIVSEGAWRRFVAREITPRFPDGLTILEARGQWRNPANKRIIRERSNVVLIVLPGNVEDQDRLGEVAEAYKRQFRQQSVGIIVRPACVSF
jgi:Protein of unknown function (DUF3574)